MADLEIGTMETHTNSQSSQTHLGEGLCRVPRSEKRLEMTPTQNASQIGSRSSLHGEKTSIYFKFTQTTILVIKLHP